MHTPHMSIQALECQDRQNQTSVILIKPGVKWIQVQCILNRRKRSFVFIDPYYIIWKKHLKIILPVYTFYLKPLTVAMSGYNSYLVGNLELCL